MKYGPKYLIKTTILEHTDEKVAYWGKRKHSSKKKIQHLNFVFYLIIYVSRFVFGCFDQKRKKIFVAKQQEVDCVKSGCTYTALSDFISCIICTFTRIIYIQGMAFFIRRRYKFIHKLNMQKKIYIYKK